MDHSDGLTLIIKDDVDESSFVPMNDCKTRFVAQSLDFIQNSNAIHIEMYDVNFECFENISNNIYTHTNARTRIRRCYTSNHEIDISALSPTAKYSTTTEHHSNMEKYREKNTNLLNT